MYFITHDPVLIHDTYAHSDRNSETFAMAITQDDANAKNRHRDHTAAIKKTV